MPVLRDLRGLQSVKELSGTGNIRACAQLSDFQSPDTAWMSVNSNPVLPVCERQTTSKRTPTWLSLGTSAAPMADAGVQLPPFTGKRSASNARHNADSPNILAVAP
jgi:hypothetical protein